MRVAIAGAGMAGSYLCRLLREGDMSEVDVYDVKKEGACGARPCAWGFAPSKEYYRLVSRFLDADQFVMDQSHAIVIDGEELDADVLTVNKPALIRAMMDGVEILRGEIDLDRYDRVIDATGVERAYLGPTLHPELIAHLAQIRVTTSKDLGTWINASSIGYEWCFPLGGGSYHIGRGSLRSGAEGHDLLHYVDDQDYRLHCRCTSTLRLSAPFHSLPFVRNGKVVGVGESIGTVAPMGGDGNLYSMQCAELLLEHWDNLDRYQEDVLKKFDWMRKERLAIERMMNGEFPSVADMRTFIEHARRVGFGIGPVHAIRFFAKAIQTDRKAEIRLVDRG